MKDAGAHVAYINAKEGALAWLDTWAMTSGVRDKDLAEAWVNFVLQKKIGQQLSDRNGFGNTVVPYASAGGERQAGLSPAGRGSDQAFRSLERDQGDAVSFGETLRPARRRRSGRAMLLEQSMTDDRILLELRSVSKSFGPTAVLEDIELAVRDGEFITILGPSGSGKTTILRMIGGFTQPSGGEILLEGRDITAHADQPAALQYRVPGLCAVPAYDRGGQCRLWAHGPRHGRAAKSRRKVGEALDLVQLGPFGRPLSRPAFRRPAPARGAGPRHHLRAAAHPARRAAGRPRCRAAQADAALPQGSSSARSAPPSSSSPTTRRRRSPSPTGSAS